MRKFFIFVVLAIAASGVANAEGYNRIGLSYNNTSYRFSGYKGASDHNFSVNGFGIDYAHGFGLSRSLPMFIEVGGNVNFNFGNMFEDKNGSDYEIDRIQDINLQVPVNYVYRFDISDYFSIAPYAGVNFKLHLMTRTRYEEKYQGEKETEEWNSLYDKDFMGEEGTWNRFQMGWQIGVNFQYSAFSLGVQYGTDFIPTFSYNEDGYKEKINNGNLKLTLGYNF